MTYSGLISEVSCIKEIKKIKSENNKLKKIIDVLETDNNIKNYEIQKLKDKLKKIKSHGISQS